MEFRLPIGTILTINDIKYPVLLIGHELTINDGVRYNYTGVLHPVGFSPDVDMMFFNHSDIKEILQIGLADFEHVTFSDLLDLEFGKNIYEKVEINEKDLESDSSTEDDYFEL